MTQEIRKYSDEAMFLSEQMPVGDKGVEPRVTLLSMTPDPLGAAAAPNMMYRGIVVRSLKDVPDEERRKVLSDMAKTRLTAPLEFIDLHFMVEGVTRAFTHQMVRQRTAVYAQESMRFSVVEGQEWRDRAAMPPDLTERQRIIWAQTMNTMQDAYKDLIDDGVPAEDARGLMPHAMTTRLHYKTNLRNLVDHVGNRLCTQAQFEWRKVAMGFADAIRNYQPNMVSEFVLEDMQWQYEAIANSWMFSPVCYHTGKCEFMASADRFCAIRDRVETFHQIGVRPEWWDARLSDRDAELMRRGVPGIFPGEWLIDPTAARKES
jgi:flavin-dependent thymidylate synthase